MTVLGLLLAVLLGLLLCVLVRLTILLRRLLLCVLPRLTVLGLPLTVLLRGKALALLLVLARLAILRLLAVLGLLCVLALRMVGVLAVLLRCRCARCRCPRDRSGRTGGVSRIRRRLGRGRRLGGRPALWRGLTGSRLSGVGLFGLGLPRVRLLRCSTFLGGVLFGEVAHVPHPYLGCPFVSGKPTGTKASAAGPTRRFGAQGGSPGRPPFGDSSVPHPEGTGEEMQDWCHGF